MIKNLISNCLYISHREHQSIIDNVKLYKDGETGGPLFGKEDNQGNPIVFKVINPITECKRTATSFILDLEYVTKITRTSEENGLEYLGTWHKHLGYGAHSHGDDNEAKHYLEKNRHKRKVISLVVDIQGSNYDLYVASYEYKNGHIIKKVLNLVIISTKELKNLALKYLSSLNVVRAILDQLEKVLNTKCLLLNRQITKEYLVQIPLSYNIQKESLDKNDIQSTTTTTIVSVKKEIQFFVYLSIPICSSSIVLDKQEKILIGIASKDYSLDISICSFQFKHIFNQTLIPEVIKKIVENSSRCIKMPLSQFLLKEICY